MATYMQARIKAHMRSHMQAHCRWPAAVLETPLKLAFVSCAKLQQVNPQPVWSEIRAARPDALLLLGDTVYLDHDQHQQPALLAAALRRLYRAQRAEPHFAGLLTDLRARGAPLLAVYDDHDFLGDERCGGDNSPQLAQAARLALLQGFAPHALPTTGDDLYSVTPLGLVDLVLLDTRFYRRAPAVSAQDPDGLLGARQWAWLQQRVGQAAAWRYLVLASSSTVHDYGNSCWEHYPAAFARLRRLLASHPAALVLSGDIHRNAAYDESGVIELVSSGVASRSRLFGVLRQNYGLLDFDALGVQVDLRSLKVGGRFNFHIPRSRWALP